MIKDESTSDTNCEGSNFGSDVVDTSDSFGVNEAILELG